MSQDPTTHPPNGQPPGKPQRDMIADAAGFLYRGASRTALAAKTRAAAAVAGVTKAGRTALRSVGEATVKAARVAADRPARAWMARLLILPAFFFICVNINAEGIRNSLDYAATPLYKLPFLAALGDFEETRRIDVAVLIALGVMTAVWVVWEKLVGLYLRPTVVMTNEEKLMAYVGLPMLVADAWMFLKGVYGGGALGGPGDDLISAVLLTVLYAGGIVICAWGVDTIRHGIPKKKEASCAATS